MWWHRLAPLITIVLFGAFAVRETNGGCTALYSADGYCDGVNNNFACDFDGGDCCSSTCVNAEFTCSYADCQDPCAKEDYTGHATCAPTLFPTATRRPTLHPTLKPTPALEPTRNPTPWPTVPPTPTPTVTYSPSSPPSPSPTTAPTSPPSRSYEPSLPPTDTPTLSALPTPGPTFFEPTPQPTQVPTNTAAPTVDPQGAVTATTAAEFEAAAMSLSDTSGDQTVSIVVDAEVLFFVDSFSRRRGLFTPALLPPYSLRRAEGGKEDIPAYNDDGDRGNGPLGPLDRHRILQTTPQPTPQPITVRTGTIDVSLGSSLVVRSKSSSRPAVLARWASEASTRATALAVLRDEDGTGDTLSNADVPLSSAPLFEVRGTLVLIDLVLSSGSSANGGAVRVRGLGARFEAARVLFTHCASAKSGGALHASGGASLSLVNAKFTACVSLLSGGGAALVDKSTANRFDGVTFVRCASTSSSGGALALSSGAVVVSLSAGIRCVECWASQLGGSLYLHGEGTSLAILSGTVAMTGSPSSASSPPYSYPPSSSLQAYQGGGVALLAGANFSTSLLECVGLRANLASCLHSGASCTATVSGGGVVAWNYGDSLVNQAAAVYAVDSVIALQGVRFEGNHLNPLNQQNQQGCALYALASLVFLKQCSFRNHSAQGSGGAVNAVHSTLEALGVNATWNFATQDGGFLFASGGSKVTLAGCLLEGNKARGSGGAVFVSSVYFLRVSSSAFKGNIAGGEGGAVHAFGVREAPAAAFPATGEEVASQYQGVILSDCLLEGNSAGVGGGGVRAKQSLVLLQRCTFTDNTCAKSSALSCPGSAVAATEDLIFEQCEVSNTLEASEEEGALVLGRRVAVDGSVLRTNLGVCVRLLADSNSQVSPLLFRNSRLNSSSSSASASSPMVSTDGSRGVWSMATCGDVSWETYNHLPVLVSLGVSFAPVCPDDAVCAGPTPTAAAAIAAGDATPASMSCTCAQGSAYPDLYQGFAACGGSPAPTATPPPSLAPSRSPSQRPTNPPTHFSDGGEGGGGGGAGSVGEGGGGGSGVDAASQRNGELGAIDDVVLDNDDTIAAEFLSNATVSLVILLALILALLLCICCCRCPWKRWRTHVSTQIMLSAYACWDFREARHLKRRHAEVKRGRRENWDKERARRRALGLGPLGGGTFGGRGSAGSRHEQATWSSLSGGVHSVGTSVVVVQGMALIESGDLERAVEVLELACGRSPSDVDAHFQLGRAHEKLLDFDAALIVFQKVLLLDPRDCASLTKCGICLEALGGDSRAAIDSYRTALKLLRSFGDKLAARRRAQEASAVAAAAAAAAEAATAENGGAGDEAKAAIAAAVEAAFAADVAAAAAESADAAEGGMLSESQVKQLVKYTLFNLGRCFEVAGYLKEAVATFTQLASIAEKELNELEHLSIDDFMTEEYKQKKNETAVTKRLLPQMGKSFVVGSKKAGKEGSEEEHGIQLISIDGTSSTSSSSGFGDDNDDVESKKGGAETKSTNGEDADDFGDEVEEEMDEDEREAREDAERLMKAFQESRSVELNEDLGEALFHLARLHSKRGDASEAAKALERLVELTKTHRGKGGELDICPNWLAVSLMPILAATLSYVSILQKQKSPATLPGQAPHPDVIENMKKLALALDECGELDRAAELYQKHILVAEPEDARNHFELARIMQRAKDHEGSVVVYKQCLVLDPLFPNALTNLGLCFESLGNHTEAERSYKRALRLDEDDAETLELLGRCLSGRGRHRDAVKAFTRLRKLLPDDLEVQRELAKALRKGGNVDGALDCLERVLDMDENYLPALVDYAWLLEKSKNFDDSIVAYEDALALVERTSESSSVVGSDVRASELRTALERCIEARDQKMSKGGAVRMRDLEGVVDLEAGDDDGALGEDALREIMSGDGSLSDLFKSGNPLVKRGLDANNGNNLATLGEEDDEEDGSDEGNQRKSNKGLKWALDSNETRNVTDVDKAIEKSIGRRADDDDDGNDEHFSRGPNCPGRHGLHSYSSPNDSMSCGSCAKKLSTGTDFYGCKLCSTSMCLSCFEEKGGEIEVEAICPNKHGLRPFKIPTDGFKCVGCATNMPKGTPSRGCKACDFSICIVCFEVPPDSVCVAEKGKAEAAQNKVNCPLAHGLRPYDAPSNLACDLCSGSVKKGDDFYGCKRCSTVVCKACYDKGGVNDSGSNDVMLNKANCPGGHGLRSYVAPNDSMSCNKCALTLAKNDPMFGCKTCKVTLCRTCFEVPSSTSAKPTCRGLHGYRPYDAPSGTLSCDKCSSRVLKGESFMGCKLCTETCCLACFNISVGAQDDANKADCPGGHGLRDYDSPSYSLKCDTCSRTLALKEKMKGCKQCKITMCIGCFAKPTIAQIGDGSTNCAGGHGLRPYNVPKNTTLACDTCKKTLNANDAFRGCKTCKETWCLACFEVPKTASSESKADCAGGHGLRPYNVPKNTTLACDICKKRLNADDAFRGCKTCKETWCLACFEVSKAACSESKADCAGGHGLRPYNVPKNTTLACDTCKKTLNANDPFRGCKTCKETWCLACFEVPETASSKSKADCAVGHGLRPYNVPKNTTLACDTCKKRLNADDAFRGCKTCKETWCLACFEVPKTASSESKADCAEGHGLRPYNVPKNTTLACDTCKKRLNADDAFRGCKTCKETWCLACFEVSKAACSESKADCAGGHGLRPYNVPKNTTLACDTCKKSLNASDPFRGCKTCKETWCLDCAVVPYHRSKSIFSSLSSSLGQPSSAKEERVSLDFDAYARGGAKTLRELREATAGTFDPQNRPSLSLDPIEMAGLGDLFGAKKTVENRIRLPSCLGAHGLRIYNVPGNKMTCQICAKEMSKGSEFRGCKQCKTTLCVSCAETPLEVRSVTLDEATTGIKLDNEDIQSVAGSSFDKGGSIGSMFADCGNGHPLKDYSAPAGRTTACGHCTRTLALKEPLWGCKACKVSLCSQCKDKKRGGAPSLAPEVVKEKERCCPHGVLHPYLAPKDLACGECDGAIPIQKPFRGCKKCALTLCMDCSSKGAPSAASSFSSFASSFSPSRASSSFLSSSSSSSASSSSSSSSSSLCSVDFTVSLRDKSLADFGASERSILVRATANALQVGEAQVALSNVRGGSVVVDVVVSGLASADHASAVASLVVASLERSSGDPSALVRAFAAAGLGECEIVSAPTTTTTKTTAAAAITTLPSPRTCQHGSLRPYNRPLHSAIACTDCARSLNQGEPFVGCKKCSLSVCSNCSAASEPQEGPPEGQSGDEGSSPSAHPKVAPPKREEEARVRGVEAKQKAEEDETMRRVQVLTQQALEKDSDGNEGLQDGNEDEQGSKAAALLSQLRTRKSRSSSLSTSFFGVKSGSRDASLSSTLPPSSVSSSSSSDVSSSSFASHPMVAVASGVDCSEGDVVAFANKRGASQVGTIVKRTGLRLRVKTKAASTLFGQQSHAWVQVQDVTHVAAASAAEGGGDDSVRSGRGEPSGTDTADLGGSTPTGVMSSDSSFLTDVVGGDDDGDTSGGGGSGVQASSLSASTHRTDCGNGHALKEYSAPPDRTTACGHCTRTLALKEPLWGCKACKVSLCSQCKDKKFGKGAETSAEKGNCALKHGLKSYQAPNDSLGCDTCAALLRKGDPMFGCKPCRVTLCSDCYEKPRAAGTASPEKANCAGGHGLKGYAAPTSPLSCGACASAILFNAEMYGCKLCKVTLCAHCYKRDPLPRASQQAVSLGEAAATKEDTGSCNGETTGERARARAAAEATAVGARAKEKGLSVKEEAAKAEKEEATWKRRMQQEAAKRGTAEAEERAKQEKEEAAQKAKAEKEREKLEKAEAAERAKQEKEEAAQKAKAEKEREKLEKAEAAERAKQEKEEAAQKAKAEKEREKLKKPEAALKASEEVVAVAREQARGQHRGQAEEPVEARAKSEQGGGTGQTSQSRASEQTKGGPGAHTTATAAAPRKNCPGAHGLKPYATPNDRMACNDCSKPMAKGAGFFGCKACKITMCAECFEKESPSSAPQSSSPPLPGETAVTGGSAANGDAATPCPHGGLKSYKSPNNTLACDCCADVMGKGSSFRGCKGCKTTLCTSCFSKDDGQAVEAPVSTPAITPPRQERNKKNCPGAHGLKPYTTPNDRMACNDCSKTMAKGAGFFGCKACKITMCTECFEKESPSSASQSLSPPLPGETTPTNRSGMSSGSLLLNCPQKHGLKQYNTPDTSFSCDNCRKSLQKGEPFRGCKACKMTVCLSCSQTNGTGI